MKYMLDTNVCIAALRGNENVIQKIFHAGKEICVSAITFAELAHGAKKNLNAEKSLQLLNDFMFSIDVMPFDDEAADCYGEIRAALEKKGQVIGTMDMLIAGHALSLGMTVVTHNTREFCRVPRLQIEDWLGKSQKSDES